MTYRQKIDEAVKRGITVSEEIQSEVNIVGVYGFFAVKGREEKCFYIGKATNVKARLLDSGNGHVYQYLKGNYEKLVPLKIDEYLKDDYQIEVRILDRIEYQDEFFTRAAHRLALSELKAIVEYQELGQCLFQLPEGIGKNERHFWEDNYKFEK